MLSGSKPAAPAASPWSSAEGSLSGYGGDAAMRDLARQRRHRRRHRLRRRAHGTTVCRRRPHRSIHRSVHRSIRRRAHTRRVRHRSGSTRKKYHRVGVQAGTGKIIYRGATGGKFVRGLHNRRRYI